MALGTPCYRISSAPVRELNPIKHPLLLDEALAQFTEQLRGQTSEMMTQFFYVFGWITTLLGVIWAAYVAAQPAAPGSLMVTAKLLALFPCFSVAAVGLIFVAVGAVLHRLDRLIED